jgi:hypothetical protein
LGRCGDKVAVLTKQVRRLSLLFRTSLALGTGPASTQRKGVTFRSRLTQPTGRPVSHVEALPEIVIRIGRTVDADLRHQHATSR